METRKIIHVDMDAFYAAIEQRDRPELRGKPVIVGGKPGTRGVVATCSYEARQYGIHSAMPAQRAYQLCPQAVFLSPNMDKYRQVSAQIMAIFRSVTDLVEPLSLDEAFLDVTENRLGIKSATIIAQQVLENIKEQTALTASAGVSYNKFLAKTASSYRKPAGLTVVTHEHAQAFIARMPIGAFFGVGRVTEQKLRQHGIVNGGDLRACTEEQLVHLLQERGKLLYRQARGIDDRPVVPNRKRKSLGKETTLAQDVTEVEDMLVVLDSLADEVCRRLQAQHIRARSVSIKVKFHDFQQVTRQKSLSMPTFAPQVIRKAVRQLLRRIDVQKRVRLLGVSTSDFIAKQSSLHTEPDYVQLELWSEDEWNQWNE